MQTSIKAAAVTCVKGKKCGRNTPNMCENSTQLTKYSRERGSEREGEIEAQQVLVIVTIFRDERERPASINCAPCQTLHGKYAK